MNEDVTENTNGNKIEMRMLIEIQKENSDKYIQ